MTWEELRARQVTPCKLCNDWHKGAVLDHTHEDCEGVGNVRLIVLGGRPEFCWRCSCQKSGYRNLPNEQSDHCADPACVCHTAEDAY